MSIKAIETRYNSYHFRSRLEARWAVFFDELKIAYQYEPEGYELEDGTWYLPDFYLPKFSSGRDVFVEIKPEHDSGNGYTLLNGLVKATRLEGALFSGDPLSFVSRTTRLYENSANHGELISSYEDGEDGVSYDQPYKFCVCRECGKVGYEFDGRCDRVCTNFMDIPAKCSERRSWVDRNPDWGRHRNSVDHPILIEAATVARSYRF